MPDLVSLDPKAIIPGKEKEAFEAAIEGRKSEIDRLWSRSLVFWAMVGAAFVAYGSNYEKGSPAQKLLISCFGLICSLAWTLQNRGSKYWQESWESKVHLIETEYLGISLFGNKEPRKQKGIWGARRYSVSRLMIAVSDSAFLTWLCLVYISMPAKMAPALSVRIFSCELTSNPEQAILIITALLGALILFKCRSD